MFQLCMDYVWNVFLPETKIVSLAVIQIKNGTILIPFTPKIIFNRGPLKISIFNKEDQAK